MAQVSVKGSVLYMPGPWGMAVPAPGLTVSLVDKDFGNPDDTIWSGSTDSRGRFSGTTSDWRDTRTTTVSTPVGSYSATSADLTDVMALYATVKQRIGNRNFEITVPFVPAPPGLPALPIVLSWGPPGRTRILVNQVPVPTVDAFATLIASLFGTGAAIASYGVRHEICVFGEQAAALRGALQSLDARLRGIEAAVLAIRRREQGGGPGTVRAEVSQARATADRVVRKVMAAGAVLQSTATSIAGSTAPAQNPWEAVRQSLIELMRGIEAVAREQAVACATKKVNAPSMVGAVAMVVVAIVAAVVAALTAPALVAISGAGLVAVVVAAIVSCVATALMNIPALLAACGCSDAAATMTTWYRENSWFGAALTIVAVVCAIIILVATLPAAGWAWVVENVVGADGAQGLRFVFAR